MADAPAALRVAQRTLDEVEGVRIAGDWEPDPSGRWRMPVDLAPDGLGTVWPVPAVTRWFLRAEPAYPGGLIDILPAAAGGLEGIFPHQMRAAAAHGSPYRGDKICVATDTEGNLRRLDAVEPSSAEDRLAWHAARAISWVVDASHGRLLRPGDHFELPFLPGAGGLHVAFREGSDGLGAWMDADATVGTADVARLGTAGGAVTVITAFRALDGRVLAAPAWGDAIYSGRVERHGALWIRCPALPIIPPYAAPRTWGELRRALEDQGADLDALLRDLVNSRHDTGRKPLLLGFPVPAVVEGEPRQMHWLAMRLAALPRGGASKRAVDREAVRWAAARAGAFAPGAPIAWGASENWHPDELATRGRVPAALADARVLLVGAGALGSAIGELLARAGVLDITLLDRDNLEARNLVRHTLAIGAIGSNKAEAVARRLREAGPNIRAAGVRGIAAGITATYLAGFDLVIDTTGDPRVLVDLARIEAPAPIAWMSASISMHARRLFAFLARDARFPAEAFHRVYEPFGLAEAARNEELPMEGVGCWHPVFPARADEVWMLASAAVGLLAGAWPLELGDGELHVFERTVDARGAFAGVQKIASA